MPPGTWPLPARYTIIGAASVGVSGAIVGLVVGLLSYPPTAWFAVFELGVPAAIIGGLGGLLAALILTSARRIKRLTVTAGRWIKRDDTQ
jgi:hypothetical protein